MGDCKPLVSVVVAAYNVERYIEKCIKSLMRQTYENLEILLIDDGATDKSREICDRHAKLDNRIRVIHKQNGGLSDVRNVGLAEASGIYLMYVDGDDYVADNYVEAAVSCAESNYADVVIFDFEEIEEDTGRRDRWSMKLPRNTVLNANQMPKVLTVTPSSWNKLYRLEFFRGTGLTYPLGRNYEDLTMNPRLLVNAARIVYLQSEPLYYYMLRDGSIMRSKNFEKSYLQRKAAIEDIVLYFREKKLYQTFERELEYLAFEHAFCTN
ncbi:MAG: glycosyltransferase [Muricomes sp.]